MSFVQHFGHWVVRLKERVDPVRDERSPVPRMFR